jgi:hypothetical protein
MNKLYFEEFFMEQVNRFFTKGTLTLFAVLAFGLTAAGTAFPQEPVGVTIGIDGFYIGDVAADDWSLTGGWITTKVNYSHKITDVVSIEAELKLNGMAGQGLGIENNMPIVKGQLGFAFPVGEGGTLELSPKIQHVGIEAGETGALDLIPQLKYTQNLGFGSMSLSLPVLFHVESGKGTSINTGDGGSKVDSADGIVLGLYTKGGPYFGPYLLVQFDLSFLEDGDTRDDGLLRKIKPRIGWNGLAGGKLGLSAQFHFNTYDDGFKKEGLSIEARAFFVQVLPGMNAYIDLAIYRIGIDKEKKPQWLSEKVGVYPGFGVLYSF